MQPIELLSTPLPCPSCGRRPAPNEWYQLSTPGLFGDRIDETIEPTCKACWRSLSTKERLACAAIWYAGILFRGGESQRRDWQTISDAVWCDEVLNSPQPIAA